MKTDKQKGNDKKLSSSFITGAIALAFLITGYQTALLVHKAAEVSMVEHENIPIDSSHRSKTLQWAEKSHFYRRKSLQSFSYNGKKIVKKRDIPPKHCESFKFNPNLASIEDLMRLGFSEKQAASIDKYRKKGGIFHRKEDFSKSFVVADSVYKRLEKYIVIPKIDINSADSATFETLPGIGAYFAAKMVSYRKALGGYSYKEQLMDIYHFDEDKFTGLEDLITVGHIEPFELWSLPVDSLKKHPYIGYYTAKAIKLYRENNPVELWTIKNLCNAGIIDTAIAEKLSRCRIAPAK